MDEYEIAYTPEQPADLMCARANAMIALAEAVDQIKHKQARDMLVAAMDCFLYSISPPRGEVVEVDFKSDTDTD